MMAGLAGAAKSMVAATSLVAALALAGCGTTPSGTAQPGLTPASFPLPLGIEEQIPADIPGTDVFVSDDFCFYYRFEGQFIRIDCVG